MSSLRMTIKLGDGVGSVANDVFGSRLVVDKTNTKTIDNVRQKLLTVCREVSGEIIVIDACNRRNSSCAIQIAAHFLKPFEQA